MQETDRQHRVILYARVSTTKDKRDPKAQDPESQLCVLREWAKKREWEVVAELADRVTGDPGKRKTDPKNLSLALDMLSRKEADILAVFAADRIIRGTVELLTFVRRVRACGGHVASYRDGADLDTTSELGELLLFMQGWFSRMELRLISERTKAGLARARAAGKRLGRAPKLIVTGADVADLRADGLSWSQVSRVLECGRTYARRAYAKYLSEKQKELTA